MPRRGAARARAQPAPPSPPQVGHGLLPLLTLTLTLPLTLTLTRSDTVCCLYGEPGGYGVVTKIASVRNGINNFLAGYIPAENMRFRAEELSFVV